VESGLDFPPRTRVRSLRSRAGSLFGEMRARLRGLPAGGACESLLGRTGAQLGELRRLTLDHRHELAHDVRTSSLSYPVSRLGRPWSGCGQQAGASQLGLGDPRRRSIPQHRAHLPSVDAGPERLLGQAAHLGGLGNREAVHEAMFAGPQLDSSPSGAGRAPLLTIRGRRLACTALEWSQLRP
jgi:hypothetical protein